MRSLLIYALLVAPAHAQNSWGQAAAPKPEPPWYTVPISPGFWMAWTWGTAAFFAFVFCCIALMGVLEWRRPGGHPRHGALGLDTTRGDRLFITLLGSAFILLGWLALLGTPLWGGLAIALTWAVLVFWKV